MILTEEAIRAQLAHCAELRNEGKVELAIGFLTHVLSWTLIHHQRIESSVKLALQLEALYERVLCWELCPETNSQQIISDCRWAVRSSMVGDRLEFFESRIPKDPPKT